MIYRIFLPWMPVPLKAGIKGKKVSSLFGRELGEGRKTKKINDIL
jgi:hypothetical protein